MIGGAVLEHMRPQLVQKGGRACTLADTIIK